MPRPLGAAPPRPRSRSLPDPLRPALTAAPRLLLALVLSLSLCLAPATRAYADQATEDAQKELEFLTTVGALFGFYQVRGEDGEDAPLYTAEFFTDMANQGISDVDVQTMREWIHSHVNILGTTPDTAWLGTVPTSISATVCQYFLSKLVSFTVGSEKTWPFFHKLTLHSNEPYFRVETPAGVGNCVYFWNDTSLAAIDSGTSRGGDVVLWLYKDGYRWRFEIENAFLPINGSQKLELPFVALSGRKINTGRYAATTVYSSSGNMLWPNGTLFLNSVTGDCKVVRYDKYWPGESEPDESSWGIRESPKNIFKARLGITIRDSGFYDIQDFAQYFLAPAGFSSGDCDICMNLDALSQCFVSNGYGVFLVGAAGADFALSPDTVIPLYGWKSDHLPRYLPDLNDYSSVEFDWLKLDKDDNALQHGVMDLIDSCMGDTYEAASKIKMVGAGYTYSETDGSKEVENPGVLSGLPNGASNSSGTGLSDAGKTKGSLVDTEHGKVIGGGGVGKSVSDAIDDGDLGDGPGKQVDPGSGDGGDGGSGSGDGSGDGDGAGDGSGSGGGAGDGSDDGPGSGSGDGDGPGDGSGDGDGKWLSGKFPFCLPFDLARLMGAFSAEPEAPKFEWSFWSPSGSVPYLVDLSPFNEVASVCRTMMLFSLVFGLVFVSAKMINMLRSAAK